MVLIFAGKNKNHGFCYKQEWELIGSYFGLFLLILAYFGYFPLIFAYVELEISFKLVFTDPKILLFRVSGALKVV